MELWLNIFNPLFQTFCDRSSQDLFQVFIQGLYYLLTFFLLRIYSPWENINVQSPSKVKSTPEFKKNGQEMVKIRFFGLISTEYVVCDWKRGLHHWAILLKILMSDLWKKRNQKNNQCIAYTHYPWRVINLFQSRSRAISWLSTKLTKPEKSASCRIEY